MSFITVHLLRALPMHNLNRDQNGLPKSQFDGGIQRGRLSSQSIKRPARLAFRDAMATIGGPSSIRTMDSNAVKVVVDAAAELATAQGRSFDANEAKKRANAVVKSLAKAAKDSDKATPDDGAEPGLDKKDNILLFSQAELDLLAQAIVEEQNGGSEASGSDFIQDFRSPSLDIAAFGRMFAARADLSTHAAIAVSHAVMTHEMSLTIDYFTAVDEYDEDKTDAGAGHLGLAYYTSGVYYSTFTIDPAQLRRSWSGVGSSTAEAQLEVLVQTLIEALPTGKLTNTNAHTKPFLVLVENQHSRTAYEFETPVSAAEDGGYKQPTVDRLAEQFDLARTYDADNYLETLLLAPGIEREFAGAETVGSVKEVAARVAGLVLSHPVSQP